MKQTITVDYLQALEFIKSHNDLSFILVIYANDTGIVLDPSKPLSLPPNTVAMSFDVNREISAQIKAIETGQVGELLQYINKVSDKVELSDGIPF